MGYLSPNWDQIRQDTQAEGEVEVEVGAEAKMLVGGSPFLFLCVGWRAVGAGGRWCAVVVSTAGKWSAQPRHSVRRGLGRVGWLSRRTLSWGFVGPEAAVSSQQSVVSRSGS